MLQQTDTRFPVAVVMERREKQRGRWSFVEWEATGVLTGEEVLTRSPEKRLIHSDADCRRYLWTNFVLQLHKDDAESYWSNLMGENPALFVVGRQDEDGSDMEPFMITANYDEIAGFQEVDDPVYAVPIPPEIYRWLEAYIVNNYIPAKRRKRKRAEWSAETHGPPSERRH